MKKTLKLSLATIAMSLVLFGCATDAKTEPPKPQPLPSISPNEITKPNTVVGTKAIDSSTDPSVIQQLIEELIDIPMLANEELLKIPEYKKESDESDEKFSDTIINEQRDKIPNNGFDANFSFTPTKYNIGDYGSCDIQNMSHNVHIENIIDTENNKFTKVMKEVTNNKYTIEIKNVPTSFKSSIKSCMLKFDAFDNITDKEIGVYPINQNLENQFESVSYNNRNESKIGFFDNGEYAGYIQYNSHFYIDDNSINMEIENLIKTDSKLAKIYDKFINAKDTLTQEEKDYSNSIISSVTDKYSSDITTLTFFDKDGKNPYTYTSSIK